MARLARFSIVELRVIGAFWYVITMVFEKSWAVVELSNNLGSAALTALLEGFSLMGTSERD